MAKRFQTPIHQWTSEDEIVGASCMPLISHTASPEASLWCGVILMAINDALGRGYRNNPRERQLNRSTAANWLLSDRRDFRLVCDLAGLDPLALRTKMATILRRP